MLKDFFSIWGDVILLTVILLSVICFLYYGVDKYIVTPQFGKVVQKQVKYDFWAGGCFVKMDNGQWIQCTRYQGVNLNQ